MSAQRFPLHLIKSTMKQAEVILLINIVNSVINMIFVLHERPEIKQPSNSEGLPQRPNSGQFPAPVRTLLSTSIQPLVATSADSVPSSNLVRITIAPIGTTFGNLQ